MQFHGLVLRGVHQFDKDDMIVNISLNIPFTAKQHNYSRNSPDGNRWSK